MADPPLLSQRFEEAKTFLHFPITQSPIGWMAWKRAQPGAGDPTTSGVSQAQSVVNAIDDETMTSIENAGLHSKEDIDALIAYKQEAVEFLKENALVAGGRRKKTKRRKSTRKRKSTKKRRSKKRRSRR